MIYRMYNTIMCHIFIGFLKVIDWWKKISWRDVFYTIPIVLALISVAYFVGSLLYLGGWQVIALIFIVVFNVWMVKAFEYFSNKE